MNFHTCKIHFEKDFKVSVEKGEDPELYPDP